MNDTELHVKAACEKRDAALDKFKWKRYMAVGDLAIKAAEQAIEAAVSLEGKYFTPIREVPTPIDSGERAEKALKALERILDGIEKETGIRFK